LKILLINPSRPKFEILKPGVSSTNLYQQPLDLASTATVLEKSEFEVKILDNNVLALNDEQFVAYLKKFYPDLIFISTSHTPKWQCPFLSLEPCYKYAGLIKKNVKANIAFIGPHPSATPDLIFRNCQHVDFLIRGEPEISALELASSLRYGWSFNKVDGVSFKTDSGVIHNPDRLYLKDLDSLPVPAFHLLPMRNYHLKMYSGPFSLFLSSRGCPFQCIFCLKAMFGDRFRSMSPEKVVDQIDFLNKNYGVEFIYFQDLEFALDKGRVIDICNEIVSRKIKIKFACSTRADRIDDELLRSLRDAGCIRINYGVETGSQEILDIVKKDITTDQIRNAFFLTRNFGIMPFGFLLTGLPGENLNTLEESMKFAKDIKLQSFIGNLPVPFPGTELHKMAIREGKLSSMDWVEAGKVAGMVGTNILSKLGDNYIWALRKMYAKVKFGKRFYMNPLFYYDTLSKLVKKYKFIRFSICFR